MYTDFNSFNRGVNIREWVRIMKGRYNINLNPELYSKGYDPDSAWEAYKKYFEDNKKIIERRINKSEKLKEAHKNRGR